MVEIGPCVCTPEALGRKHREQRSDDEEEKVANTGNPKRGGERLGKLHTL